MLKFLADENYNNHVVRGLRRQLPELDLVRVHELGMLETPDPELLEWAAQEGRIILTRDRRTFPDFVEARLQKQLPMPGVFYANQNASVSALIEDLIVLATCSELNEWEGQSLYLPLRSPG